MPKAAAGRFGSLWTALHSDTARTLGTALTGRGGKAMAGWPGALRSSGLRCAPTALRFSVPRPAAKLPPLTSFAVVGQRPRVSLRSALARAASRPAMLGALMRAPGQPATALRMRTSASPEDHRCVRAQRSGRPPGRLVKLAGVPLAEVGWRGVVERAGAPSWRGLGGAHGNRVLGPKSANGRLGSIPDTRGRAQPSTTPPVSAPGSAAAIADRRSPGRVRQLRPPSSVASTRSSVAYICSTTSVPSCLSSSA
jgi:hypothetical protein